jgi:hypothetical protein
MILRAPDGKPLLQEGADLIDGRRSLRDQPGADVVESLEVELVCVFLRTTCRLGRSAVSATASASL